MADKTGVPANFSGIIIPNPNHIQPHLDTDRLTADRIGSYQGSVPMASPIPTRVQTVRTKRQPFDTSNPPASSLIPPVLRSFHRGGTVPKDGIYRLKKGEHVLTRNAYALSQAMKKR